MRRATGALVTLLAATAVALAAMVGLITVPAGAEGVDTFAGATAPTAHAVARRSTAVQLTEAPAPPAHPVPAASGIGRRAIYSKGQQRVWIVEADETVTRTYLVSGRLDQPAYGTYRVWSRSSTTYSRSSPDITMRWMVRFAFSNRGDNIGFHDIPMRDGRPMQTADQLGFAISGGCVRQATDDALFMWSWAQIGTVVVVVA